MCIDGLVTVVPMAYLTLVESEDGTVEILDYWTPEEVQEFLETGDAEDICECCIQEQIKDFSEWLLREKVS